MYSRGTSAYYDLFGDECGQPGSECNFIQRLAPHRGNLLDIGAGVGNTAFGLAQAGFEVTALEPDAEMFAVLLARLALRKDLESRLSPLPRPAGFALRKKFDVCTCFSVLHLQQPHEQRELFEFAAAHLVAGGRFVLEVPVNSPARVERARSLVAEQTFGDTTFRHYSALQQRPSDGWNTRWEFTIERGDEVIEHAVQDFAWRACNPTELNAMAVAADLVIDRRYADFEESAFVEEDSRVLVAVAHKRA